MTLALPHPADDRPEVIAGEVVSRDVVLAGVLEELPAAGAAALVRVPGIALDPFARLVDAFLDEAPPNTARGYRTDLAQWITWLTREAVPEYRTDPLLATRPHVAAWRKHLEATQGVGKVRYTRLDLRRWRAEVRILSLSRPWGSLPAR